MVGIGERDEELDAGGEGREVGEAEGTEEMLLLLLLLLLPPTRELVFTSELFKLLVLSGAKLGSTFGEMDWA